MREIRLCLFRGNLNRFVGIPMKQETKSFDKTNDSVKKKIVAGKSMKPRRNEKGYLMIGVKEFLLDPNSLEL